MNSRPIWMLAALIVAGQAGAAIEQQLAECAAIADKLDRLVCYDELAAGVAASPTQAPPRTATNGPREAPASTAAESEFGLKHKEPEPKQDPDKIYLEVAGTDRDPYGALIISFTNGQIWKQIDQRYHTLESGERVFVEKAALRSFMLGSDSRTTKIRVRRLR